MKHDSREKVQRLNRLSYDFDQLYHQAARTLDMSDSALRILYALCEQSDGRLLQDVCRESGVSKQTINSALRKLESEDILYLEQDRGKSKRVFLTEKGRAYAAQTAARLYAAECDAFDDWTEEELELYLNLMHKHVDSLRAQINRMERSPL